MKTYTEKEILEYLKIKQNKRLGKDRLLKLCQQAGLIVSPIKESLKGKGSVIQYQIIENNYILPDEKWIECIYDNNYEVSNLGRVRNIKNKRLLGFKDDKGYLKIMIKNSKPIGIHRLVYFSFNPKNYIYEKYFTIDHIDGRKDNNILTNLRPLSNLENNLQKDQNQTKIKTLIAQLIEKYGYEETVQKIKQLL